MSGKLGTPQKTVIVLIAPMKTTFGETKTLIMMGVDSSEWSKMPGRYYPPQNDICHDDGNEGNMTTLLKTTQGFINLDNMVHADWGKDWDENRVFRMSFLPMDSMEHVMVEKWFYAEEADALSSFLDEMKIGDVSYLNGEKPVRNVDKQDHDDNDDDFQF